MNAKKRKVTAGILAVSIIICAVCAAAARKNTNNSISVREADKTISYYTYEEEDDTRPIVCIDAGHGGSDGGAVYDDAYEKDETLMIARLVKGHLESMGVKVVMTREDDTFLGLDERVEICNNASCDVMVSIHRNMYAADTSINGVETWIHHLEPEGAVVLGNAINERICAISGIKNRGVKGGSMTDSMEDYRINANSECTACLIELGFMSNQNDNRLVTEKKEEAASAIANGIMEYLNWQETLE